MVANGTVASAYASEQATDNMSASPPKQEGVEPVQSPDEEQPMDRNTEENTAQIGYEFEVKEQDRWLPIANGTSISLAASRQFDLRTVSLQPARRQIAPTGVSGCRQFLHSRVSASNHGKLYLPQATQILCVPGKRPACSLRNVVLFSPLVHFPTVVYAKEHKREQQYRIRC